MYVMYVFLYFSYNYLKFQILSNDSNIISIAIKMISMILYYMTLSLKSKLQN